VESVRHRLFGAPEEYSSRCPREDIPLVGQVDLPFNRIPARPVTFPIYRLSSGLIFAQTPRGSCPCSLRRSRLFFSEDFCLQQDILFFYLPFVVFHPFFFSISKMDSWERQATPHQLGFQCAAPGTIFSQRRALVSPLRFRRSSFTPGARDRVISRDFPFQSQHLFPLFLCSRN